MNRSRHGRKAKMMIKKAQEEPFGEESMQGGVQRTSRHLSSGFWAPPRNGELVEGEEATVPEAGRVQWGGSRLVSDCW